MNTTTLDICTTSTVLDNAKIENKTKEKKERAYLLYFWLKRTWTFFLNSVLSSAVVMAAGGSKHIVALPITRQRYFQ